MTDACLWCEAEFEISRPDKYFCSQKCCKSAGKWRARISRQNGARVVVLEYKLAHPCLCGEAEPVCLDLHHKDPAHKNFEISKMISSAWHLKISELKQEIEKCECVCANCHRKHHVVNPPPQNKKTREERLLKILSRPVR